MKKLLFVINSLTIGGSEKSLVSLLNLIDYSKYEVDLMLFKSGEDFDRYIPKEVNVIEEPLYYQFCKGRTNFSIKNKINFNLTRLKTALNLRINSVKKTKIQSEQVLYKSQKGVLCKLDKSYDVAIAYSQGMPTYFVADKVVAKRKIAWINCDYTTTGYDKEFDYLFYKKISKIVVVSNTIKESIIKLIPEYKNKIEVILDIVDPFLLEKMSNDQEGIFNNSSMNILTVARLVIHYKGFDIALKAAKLLKENNYKFKWFVIGDGPDRKEIEDLINSYRLNDCFILLGKRENPYPFIKECDLYVQPSKKEGFGLTVIEAKILKKPIICTNFNTAKELIKDNKEGLIVGVNEKDLYIGIKSYINNDKFWNEILSNIRNIKPYSSINEIKKFYQLLE